MFCSIDKLFKNSNMLKSEGSRTSATPSYSESTKPENLFDEKKIIKNTKIIKEFHDYKCYLSMLKF